MREELRQFYSYLGPRWGGGGVIHLEFVAEGLPLHVEAVQDNLLIPSWIAEKMSDAEAAEVQALFKFSKPRREESERVMAELIAAEQG